MEAKGNLSKMKTQVAREQVEYHMQLENESVKMNDLIGKEITLEYQDQINCIVCGKKTATSFIQGFCYNCYKTAPEAEDCVFNPETCRAHLGEARDMEFAQKQCLIPHYVYLAVASGIKVGVTRNTQIPTRWIDQGAWKAVVIAEVPNRHIAGVIEVFLKDFYSDKTNWRNMLKNELAQDIDLIAEKKKAIDQLPDELKQYVKDDEAVWELNYPVTNYPLKPKSLTFDKEASITGVLQGIKGQYLLFDKDRVLNIRRHNGYLISLKA